LEYVINVKEFLVVIRNTATSSSWFHDSDRTKLNILRWAIRWLAKNIITIDHQIGNACQIDKWYHQRSRNTEFLGSLKPFYQIFFNH